MSNVSIPSSSSSSYLEIPLSCTTARRGLFAASLLISGLSPF